MIPKNSLIFSISPELGRQFGIIFLSPSFLEFLTQIRGGFKWSSYLDGFG